VQQTCSSSSSRFSSSSSEVLSTACGTLLVQVLVHEVVAPPEHEPATGKPAATGSAADVSQQQQQSSCISLMHHASSRAGCPATSSTNVQHNATVSSWPATTAATCWSSTSLCTTSVSETQRCRCHGCSSLSDLMPFDAVPCHRMSPTHGVSPVKLYGLPLSRPHEPHAVVQWLLLTHLECAVSGPRSGRNGRQADCVPVKCHWHLMLFPILNRAWHAHPT
jgi:hypothetical protein